MKNEHDKHTRLLMDMDYRMQRIEKIIATLRRRAELMEDSGESLMDELRQFRDWVVANRPLIGERSAKNLIARAEKGIRQLTAVTPFRLRGSEGQYEIRVGQSAWFPIAPRLKELVVVSASMNAPDAEIAAWIPGDDVRAMLEVKYGRPVTAHALTERVYCLRKLFTARGVRHLIETHPKSGIRLWLRPARDDASGPPR